MAVVIGINELGERSYKSSNQGILSNEQKAKADKLNDLVGMQITLFIQKHNLKEIKKNRFTYYWELGNILRDIFYNSGLIDPSEKELFFENARMHLDDAGDIFPKNDKKRKRNIPKQFFKLAGYHYDIAKKIEWSQWSYLFDNIYLMDCTGFDEWFEGILKSGRYKFNETFTRLWAESFNLLFKKTDLSDWTENEKIKPFICSLEIVNILLKEGVNIESRSIRKKTKYSLVKILKEHRKDFILMQMGNITENDYVDTITNKTLSLFKQN